jgi:hypothetical protein
MGWHYNDLTAATGAPSAFVRPMGYTFDAQSTQHVIYAGPDWHIHELWWDSNGWHHNDLTAAASAPLAFEAPWGYVFAAQGTQHVVYLGLGAGGQGIDGHIHELWWDSNGWHHNDLTAAAGAPLAAVPPIGYAFETQRTQHVFYVNDSEDPDVHVHELWWDSNGWHHNDLTVAADAPNSLGNNLTGHVFFAQGTQHVFYEPSFGGGTNDHINELWWDSNGWHNNDLTVAAGAPTWGLGDLRTYVFAAQGTQHVLYQATGEVGQGSDGHIHELWWDSGGWHHNDLTVAAGAPLASQPTGYMFDAQGTQHVVFQGLGADPYTTDGHVHELWWDSQGWHHNDLTAATGAPLAETYPMGYGFVAQGTQHVVYQATQATDFHVIELYWTPD